MNIKTGKKIFTILIIFVIFAVPFIHPEAESGIIPIPDLTILLKLLSNIEDSMVSHEWEIVFNAFLSPEFTEPYRVNDRWKSVEWMAPIFYPEIKPVDAKESLEIANSIKAVKHFISSIIVYKEPNCEFSVEMKGIRTIDFLPGKKYFTMDMKFCKKGDLWILLQH